MSSTDKGQMPVDVICPFNSDGKIIPFRLRIQDEEGEYHAYTINEYKELSHMGDYVNADGVNTHSSMYEFDCEITVFKKKQWVKLFYNCSAYSSAWNMCFISD